MILFIQILLVTTSFAVEADFGSDSIEYFEGKITYDHSYEPDSLAGYLGSESIFYYKAGNYKQVFNGEKVKESTYNRKDNSIYSFIGEDTVITSCDQKSEIIKDYDIFEDAAEILGEKCDLLVLRTNSRLAYYYFSNKYSINPAALENHKYSSLSFVYSKTKSLPLKIINQYSNFKVTMTAVKIEKKQISEDFFNFNGKSHKSELILKNK
ncbi:MAG: hypothetical protein MI921_10820 [Cytophagales bacterium]|nr:hypothetical protein [Cytophagales bacterium]